MYVYSGVVKVTGEKEDRESNGLLEKKKSYFFFNSKERGKARIKERT